MPSPVSSGAHYGNMLPRFSGYEQLTFDRVLTAFRSNGCRKPHPITSWGQAVIRMPSQCYLAVANRPGIGNVAGCIEACRYQSESDLGGDLCFLGQLVCTRHPNPDHFHRYPRRRLRDGPYAKDKGLFATVTMNGSYLSQRSPRST